LVVGLGVFAKGLVVFFDDGVDLGVAFFDVILKVTVLLFQSSRHIAKHGCEQQQPAKSHKDRKAKLFDDVLDLNESFGVHEQFSAFANFVIISCDSL